MNTINQLTIRLERQPHREALWRLHAALRWAQQAGLEFEKTQTELSFQEVSHANPGSPICPSIHPAAGAGSDD